MDKTRIESMRKAAQARFDGATTPEAVKEATEELANLDAIEKEVGELETQNASLLASYKDIVKHEPITNKPEPEPDMDEEEGRGLEFAEALDKIISARKPN